jgi:phosphatidylglycerophosphatase A
MTLLAKIIATGFGAGYFPIAPGTAGSLLALVPVALFFPSQPSSLIPFIFFLIIVAVFFAGVWASGRAERIYGHDPSCVVIDEIVGMWLTIFLIPPTALWLLAGFVLFRLLDITKWLGADRAQRIPGGWGVMADDVVSGLWGNLILQVALRLTKQ